MNRKCLVLGIAALLSLCAVSSGNITNYKAASADETILVGEAETYEDKVKVAAENLSLNVNLDTIVTTLNLPSKGLYNAEIGWESSNEDVVKVSDDLKYAYVTRQAEDTKVDLTATLAITDNKNNVYKATKVFNLTVLKKSSSEVVSTKTAIDENFSSYDTGDDLGEYLRWDLSSGNGITEVVENVPNNDMISGAKAVRINSKKVATTTSYVRNFYLDGNVVFEGYMMYNDDINGVYFDLGRDDVYGPSIGITNGQFAYYSNGDVIVNKSVAAPVEGVWNKFRIVVNSSFRSYSVYVYKMDGSGDLITLKENVAYAGTGKYLKQLRIRTVGGSKLGAVYATGLKVDSLDNMPVSEGTNPNRTNGIGTIDNFQESVLYINGTTKDYESGFTVHNRFDESEIYTEGTDYEVSEKSISSNEKEDVNKYTITLKSTGETRVLTQTVYKEDETSLPYIDSFKASHLAQKVINTETGELSSTGTITVSGNVTRSDGTIYAAVTDSDAAPLSAEEVIAAGTGVIASYSGAQSERTINFEFNNLNLNKEYAVYVVVKNANGVSEVYSKKEISTTINITSCEEFYDMTVNVDTYKNTFRLTKDLDFEGYDWVCDANNTLKFAGTLDGQGHTIKNLSIQSPYRKAAIFFEIQDATIKNLNIDGADISGLQDVAVLCGFSNGGTFENISINNANVLYNNIEGSEGYFSILVGRVQKDTIVMRNISITNGYIKCNKYTGAIAGNVNKDGTATIDAKNLYVDCKIYCDGAAVGTIGRNRGKAYIDNAVLYITVQFAKKEMGVVAGHNKEGGYLKATNVLGSLAVNDCTQPTYFNNFIGSHDANTSSYDYENVYFIQGDYSSISDNIVPTATTRTCGVTLVAPEDDIPASWYEKNTFIYSFEADPVWVYDETLQRPVLDMNKNVNLTADQVNAVINLIQGNLSEDDHYYIYKALKMYEVLSDSEKAKVNYTKLTEEKAKYESLINDINSVVNAL